MKKNLYSTNCYSNTVLHLSIALLLSICFVFNLSAQQVTGVKNSWLGNSNADPNTFMPQGIEGMYVSSDGTVYTNVGWEEGGGQFTQVKNGEVIHAGGCFGWGRYGGYEVAANSTYVYFAGEINNEGGGLVGAIEWPVGTKNWTGVSRRNKSDITTGTPFSDAKGQAPYTYFKVMIEMDNDAAPFATGLYATETELFAAFSDLNKVMVYDANTMAFKREFAVTTPRQIAMDADGMLWIAIGMDATKIERYDINGVKQTQEINLAANSFVGDFSVDNTNRMLVGDVGQREQVIIYTNINSTPVFTSTFGALNGMFSGVPGKCAPLKFNQIRGIGTDNSGNIYIGNTQWGTGGQGIILESYNLATTALNWSKYCVMFVDAMGIDAATDGQDIYGMVEHFTVDYSKPEGQEATYSAYTINKYKYPHDPRLNTHDAGSSLGSVAVRNFNGHKFLSMSGMNGGTDAIFRFNPATDGEVAIPCVVFGWEQDPLYPGSPNEPWLWRDLNANGLPEIGEYVNCEVHITPDGGYGATMDDNGDIWVAVGDKINHMRCLGVAANGIPMYDGTFTEIPKPIPFNSVRRVQYNAAEDRLYLGGTTTNYPDVHPWRAMGRAIHRYDNWSTGNRIAQSELVVPYEVASNTETVSFKVEKDYIFTVVDADRSPVFPRGQVNIFKVSNNSPVGHINAPWANVGYPDMVQCVDVYKRQNGEYIIIQEEDGRNKNLMYRWTPDLTNYAVVGVTVNPVEKNLLVNEIVQLIATITPANASNRIVTWATSNAAVAMVSTNGLVKATALGTATITATTSDGNKTAISQINVLPPPQGTWVLADDKDPGWVWSGFEFDACASCFEGSAHSTEVLNSFATYTFTGTEVEVYCETWDGAGSNDIFIDNVLKGSFSQRIQPYGGANKFATISGLSNGSHTIKIVATTTDWTGIDYIRFKTAIVLPLQLISFTAKLENGKARLKWKTENEINVSHFDIERSSDGNRFDKIKEIASGGNGNYNTLDVAPQKGYNYYRLKMVDKDGRFSYSNVEMVKSLNDAIFSFIMYPNPNNGLLVVEPSQSNKPVIVSIFDQQGRLLLVKQITGKTPIAIHHLAKGIYTVKMIINGEVKTGKLIKQ